VLAVRPIHATNCFAVDPFRYPAEQPSTPTKALALTGLGLTLFYLVGVFLGTQAQWPLWPLGMGALVLRSLGRKIANPETTGNRDWQNVPTGLREIFPLAKKIVDTAFLLTVLLTYWNLLHSASAPKIPGSRFAFQVVLDVEVAFLYALEALFFEYGELRTHRPG